MVIALDKHKRPLGFMTERRARKLMERKRAVLYRAFPATVVVKDVDARKLDSLPSYRVKVDPGAEHTGIAVVCNETDEAVLYLQVHHRGQEVKGALKTRKDTRRNRRGRETRYRRCKFRQGGKFNSPRPAGWLPPSVASVAGNITHWVEKLSRLINITGCSYEAVRFDTQLMENPDISGEEYQHGTLYGYELREYLLEKAGHVCQYCGGASGDPVLEWEHMVPRSRGGSDRVKNAALACRACNRDKGSMTAEEYLEALRNREPRGKHAAELNKARASCTEKLLEGRAPAGNLRYCAWAGSMRRRVERVLFSLFGDVECSSGGRTKYNRTRLGLPKDHHYDALCTGHVPENGYRDRTGGYVLHVEATGRGTRFRGKVNACGVITKKLEPRAKRVYGFMNGDIVRAEVAKGKYTGTHTGRVMTRAKGNFDIRRMDGELVTANVRYCRILQYGCGYKFCYKNEASV